MDKRVSIPVRVVRPSVYPDATRPVEAAVARATDNGQGSKLLEEPRLEVEETRTVEPGAHAVEAMPPAPTTQDELEEWRDRALRLQAEMDTYRKRQQRLAQDQMEAERQRLLGSFLPIVDNLERALAATDADGEGLRQGVALTHRAALHLLRKEGVEPIEAQNQPFDPNWHEAVATVGHDGGEAVPGLVIQVAEPGYRLGDHLLRPARVVVAV